MPTFREDLHLGHEVPMIGTEDINNGSVTTDKIADGAITSEKIGDGEVNTQDLADGAVTSEKIKDGEVKTADIADGSITPEKLSDRIVPEVIKPLLEPLKDRDNDLQNQIDSLTINGMAVSGELGNDPHIGVSQKALTGIINRIWSKISDITGEMLQGFSIVVTPDYYIGEEGCNVLVSVSTVDTAGVFEYIKVYANDFLIGENEDVESWEFSTEIAETTVLKVVAKILGVEYTEQKVITHYSSLWLGAGSTYVDVMNLTRLIPIANGMRGAYNIDVEGGDRIIVVVGEHLREGFIRADINGVEIPFTEEVKTINGNKYSVFTSENTYQAGTYNIDING